MNISNKKLLKLYHDLLNTRSAKCLFPGMACENKTVKAHSIQNARTFDLLQSNGHLVGFKLKTQGSTPPRIEFQHIGRNQASTFYGLCAEHDNQLFEKIDNYSIDINNQEQLFLLAYRSILKELHACMNRSIRLQYLYQEKVEQNLISGNEYTKEGRTATEAHMISYETFLYKEKYEALMANQDYKSICHVVLEFSTDSPTIACSQLFTIDNIVFEDFVLRVIINIFPVSENITLVIFSFTRDEQIKATDAIYKCLRGHDNELRKYEVSKFVIEKSDNFFISAKYFEQWPSRKRAIIQEYFSKTILEDFDFDDPDLMLFQ